MIDTERLLVLEESFDMSGDDGYRLVMAFHQVKVSVGVVGELELTIKGLANGGSFAGFFCSRQINEWRRAIGHHQRRIYGASKQNYSKCNAVLIGNYQFQY